MEANRSIIELRYVPASFETDLSNPAHVQPGIGAKVSMLALNFPGEKAGGLIERGHGTVNDFFDKIFFEGELEDSISYVKKLLEG